MSFINSLAGVLKRLDCNMINMNRLLKVPVKDNSVDVIKP